MLHRWNRDFERGEANLPKEAWDQWIWNTRLHDPITADVMLNEMHLLGLLIARYRAKFFPSTMDIRLNSFWPTFVHGGLTIRSLTLRQLKDSFEDLQFHWDTYSEDWDAVAMALDALMARFGAFNLEVNDTALMDDISCLDPDKPGCLSLSFIRRMTASFCVLYRHIHLASVANVIEDARVEENVENCHVQAGLDAFYRHYMHSDLPPCAKIVYRQDFAGMYSCVTQVIYYHYPSYFAKKNPILIADLKKNAWKKFCRTKFIYELRKNFIVTTIWSQCDAC